LRFSGAVGARSAPGVRCKRELSGDAKRLLTDNTAQLARKLYGVISRIDVERPTISDDPHCPFLAHDIDKSIPVGIRLEGCQLHILPPPLAEAMVFNMTVKLDLLEIGAPNLFRERPKVVARAAARSNCDRRKGYEEKRAAVHRPKSQLGIAPG
jgi:hypothetical protein